MQPERGGSRPRREGGRHGRRGPPGSAEKNAVESGGTGPRGGGGRGRGGAQGHRGGGGRGRREPRGRGAPPPAHQHRRRVEEDGDTESREEEEKEELKSYSRRKIFSNWSRYEETEKEGQSEHEESQRGTDFSVLLSSADFLLRFCVTYIWLFGFFLTFIDTFIVFLQWLLIPNSESSIKTGLAVHLASAVTHHGFDVGDSFTQFQFADEKEWDRESICHKQLSALSVDCQSLVQALQELPLHLRLNIAAELVQESTPAELPQMKSKMIEDSKRRGLLFQQSLAQSKTGLASLPTEGSVAPSGLGNKNGPRAGAAEPFQRAHPLSTQETDHLEEELDLLLNLDAPIDTENRPDSVALSSNTSTEKDLKMACEETDSPEVLPRVGAPTSSENPFRRQCQQTGIIPCCSNHPGQSAAGASCSCSSPVVNSAADRIVNSHSREITYSLSSAGPDPLELDGSHIALDMPEEKSTASEQQPSTSKTVTEEELEDWLDSIIS